MGYIHCSHWSKKHWLMLGGLQHIWSSILYFICLCFPLRSQMISTSVDELLITEGKLCGYSTMTNCRPFFLSDLSPIPKLKSMANFIALLPNHMTTNVQEPENVVNKQTDGWTDKWMAKGYSYAHSCCGIQVKVRSEIAPHPQPRPTPICFGTWQKMWSERIYI